MNLYLYYYTYLLAKVAGERLSGVQDGFGLDGCVFDKVVELTVVSSVKQTLVVDQAGVIHFVVSRSSVVLVQILLLFCMAFLQSVLIQLL